MFCLPYCFQRQTNLPTRLMPQAESAELAAASLWKHFTSTSLIWPLRQFRLACSKHRALYLFSANQYPRQVAVTTRAHATTTRSSAMGLLLGVENITKTVAKWDSYLVMCTLKKRLTCAFLDTISVPITRGISTFSVGWRPRYSLVVAARIDFVNAFLASRSSIDKIIHTVFLKERARWRVVEQG